jgi:spore germination cell wall hydrolase CwlJ-like protein
MSSPAELQNIADTALAWITVWREAQGEPMAGQIAVCYTLITRAAHPSWMGHTIEECAIKAWQYSSLTAPGDPNLIKWPKLSDPVGLACMRVADEVLRGAVGNPFPGADSYYDDSLPSIPKAWGPNPKFLGKIGRLNFYQVNLDWQVIP